MFREISKLEEISEVENILSKRKILNKLGILQLCRKLYHVHLHVSKSSSSSGNFKDFLLTMVAELRSAGCNATKNELQIKFPKDVLKISQNSQEKLSNGVPF